MAVINLAAAKRFYGTAQNALGRSIAEGGGDSVHPDTTIVGVVGDVKHQDLRTDMGPGVYRPYAQMVHPVGVQVYARSQGAPDSIEPGIRVAIQQLDPTLVVDGLRSMEAQVDSSASDERALAFLAVGFSILAMVLASVGLYGVLAYSTEQRTREIGVRLALGSQRSHVVVLVVREMAIIAAAATAIALPSSSRWLASSAARSTASPHLIQPPSPQQFCSPSEWSLSRRRCPRAAPPASTP